MAFVLSYSVEERLDNKLLTITDTSGEVSTGTATGWQAGGPNPDYTAIDGVTNTLELIISITTSDGTTTAYDAVDVFTEFGPFAAVTDLEFALDCSMLTASGTALGTSDDEFPDGIYEIEYIYNNGLAGETSTTTKELVSGIVRNAIYEFSRTIPTLYECGNLHEKQTLDILFMDLYYSSILRSSIPGRETSILTALGVLEDMLNTNTTYYNW